MKDKSDYFDQSFNRQPAIGYTDPTLEYVISIPDFIGGEIAYDHHIENFFVHFASGILQDKIIIIKKIFIICYFQLPKLEINRKF